MAKYCLKAWFGKGRFPGMSPKKCTDSGASGSSPKMLYLASNTNSVIFHDRSSEEECLEG